MNIQLLCHPQILGHGVEAWSGRPWTFSGRPSYMYLCHRGVDVHGHFLDVPVTCTVPSWSGCPWTFFERPSYCAIH